jgi:hypothetical protein
MPVVSVLPPLKSPPTNAFGLVQYLQTRVPGYDVSEYLRELNSAYIHVWEEVTKLKNQYFTNIKTVTVVTPQLQYDLMFNQDGALSSAVSSRLYQITRIRIQPPAGGLFQATIALQPNSPDFIAISANPVSSASQTGPYYWYLSGRNQLNWALPLALGTIIEVTYTFWPIALVILSGGVVGSNTFSSVTTSAVLAPGIGFVQVNSIAGLVRGQIVSIDTGANQENVEVVSILSGAVFTLQALFAKTHAIGVPVVYTPGLNFVGGVGTNFTELVQPDFLPFLPATQAQEEIQAELICNGQLPIGGQIYRVATIINDFTLTTANPVSPVIPANSPYILATLPEIPREHIRVVASIALRNMYSIDADDTRAEEWTGIAEKNIQMMKDALIERQGQNPPQKLRFPYGIGRRNRAFLR